MNIKKFDKLPRASNGLPIINLMTEPDLSDDGFLSMVNKGANGRSIQVLKQDELPDESGEREVTLHQGQEPSAEKSFFSKLFGPLFGLSSTPVSKGAVEFDVAVVIPHVFERFWRGEDALRESIHSILNDTDVKDKKAAIEVALNAFSKYVVSAFDMPVLKAEQAVEVAKYAQIEAEKRVMAQKSLSNNDLLDQLRKLVLGQDKNAQPVSKSSSSANEGQQEESMNPEQLKLVAQASAQSAISVAKAHNPNLSATELTQIGLKASSEVFKAAIGGPKQPAVPADALAKQMAMTGDATGSMSAPEKEILKAINRLTSLTQKMDKAIFGEEGEGENRDPGLSAVVAKQGELLGTLVQKYDQIAGIPQASNAGGDDAVQVQKGEEPDDVWENSPLGNF